MNFILFNEIEELFLVMGFVKNKKKYVNGFIFMILFLDYEIK